MNYDEAVESGALAVEAAIHIDGDPGDGWKAAKAVLDAVGFRQMQGRIEELTQRQANLFRNAGITSHQLVDQRDEARALADQLAEAIFPDSNDANADAQDRSAALAAYEARDWK